MPQIKCSTVLQGSTAKPVMSTRLSFRSSYMPITPMLPHKLTRKDALGACKQEPPRTRCLGSCFRPKSSSVT